MADATVYCKMSPVPLNIKCAPGECKRCGWNPVVHTRRLKALWTCAAAGKLEEWGKDTNTHTA